MTDSDPRPPSDSPDPSIPSRGRGAAPSEAPSVRRAIPARGAAGRVLLWTCLAALVGVVLWVGFVWLTGWHGVYLAPLLGAVVGAVAAAVRPGRSATGAALALLVTFCACLLAALVSGALVLGQDTGYGLVQVLTGLTPELARRLLLPSLYAGRFLFVIAGLWLAWRFAAPR